LSLYIFKINYIFFMNHILPLLPLLHHFLKQLKTKSIKLIGFLEIKWINSPELLPSNSWSYPLPGACMIDQYQGWMKPSSPYSQVLESQKTWSIVKTLSLSIANYTDLCLSTLVCNHGITLARTIHYLDLTSVSLHSSKESSRQT